VDFKKLVKIFVGKGTYFLSCLNKKETLVLVNYNLYFYFLLKLLFSVGL